MLFIRLAKVSCLYWIQPVPICCLMQILSFGSGHNRSLGLGHRERGALCWSCGLCWIECSGHCWASCSRTVPALFRDLDSDLRCAPKWLLLLPQALVAERFVVIWMCLVAPTVSFAFPFWPFADIFLIAAFVFALSFCRSATRYPWFWIGLCLSWRRLLSSDGALWFPQ